MTKNNLIQKLKDKYDAAREKRKVQELKDSPLNDRIKDILDAALYVNTDFYCHECKKDCSGPGYRRTCTLRPHSPTAWYTGFCPKGHQMIRRITDKDTDPYYDQSFVIKRQRYDLADALLTPNDPRFKILYPKQYKELMNKNNVKKNK